ncbi:MAG: four helix bundle protein [Xanthomonadales bacterium]|nr:four helix bundle protein [Xanthomonadales bacterium]
MIRNYRQLIVWQKAMELAERIYRLVRAIPDEERFGLSHQLRKCAVSIPSNIAEGHTRRSTREYLQFISIALGSIAEAETQLLLTLRLGMVTPHQTAQIEDLMVEVGKMLRAIQGKLATNETRELDGQFFAEEREPSLTPES